MRGRVILQYLVFGHYLSLILLNNIIQKFLDKLQNLQKMGLKNGIEMATDGNRKTSVWKYGLLKPIQIQVDFYKFLFP